MADSREHPFPAPWSELETKHHDHGDWPTWRVVRTDTGPEVEVVVPLAGRVDPVEVTLTRLDVKAMFLDIEGETDGR